MAKEVMDQPALTPEQYVALIRKRFVAAGDPIVAEGQMNYMRNKYAYCGLKAPQWVAILKELFREYGMYDGAKLKAFARLCFKEEYHEIFYAGLQMVEKQQKHQPAGFINFLEEAVKKGAWWDTVDWTAKLIGIHFRKYPEQQQPWCDKWIRSNNIWLQRVAIIHQLLYKSDTNEKLLFQMIRHTKGSQEFFVQKGAGWALRQYSRIKPDAVVRFLDKNPDISSLTRREALKHLR